MGQRQVQRRERYTRLREWLGGPRGSGIPRAQGGDEAGERRPWGGMTADLGFLNTTWKERKVNHLVCR